MVINEINNYVFNDVFAHLEDCNLSYCKSMGLDDQTIRRLARASEAVKNKIKRSRLTCVKFTCNNSLINQLLDSFELEQKHAELIDKALLLGASNALISDVFAKTNTEVANRRKILDINESAGRKKHLDNAVEIEVWENWITNVGKCYKLPNGQHITARELTIMIDIAEQLQVNLAAVYATIKRAYNHI